MMNSQLVNGKPEKPGKTILMSVVKVFHEKCNEIANFVHPTGHVPQ
jgi:hypothetical protein